MNEQEALELIKFKRPRTCKMVNGTYQGGFPDEESDVGIAFAIAINALEKQIAKKPSFEGDGYWNGQLVYDTWICPCCDKHYEVEYEEYEHCPSCGQKIDWSD